MGDESVVTGTEETSEEPYSLDEIGGLFHEFLLAVARPKRREGYRDLTKRLRAHLRTAPGDQPVVKAAYPRTSCRMSIWPWSAGSPSRGGRTS